jgi:hypothetical protein
LKKQFAAITILITALLLTACSSNHGGDDSAHPYSWKEKSDNSISLTIKNAPDEGWSWQFEGSGDGLIEVERTDNGKGKNATFKIVGQGVGNGTANFVCRRDALPNDASFRLDVAFTTDEKGKLSIVSSNYTEYPASGRISADGKAVCTWYMSDDGVRELYIDNSGIDTDAEWTLSGYDGTFVSADGPEYGDSGCTYSLSGLSVGETEILIYDLEIDYGFRLKLSVADDLSVGITGSEAGTFELSADEIPGINLLTALVGDIYIPDGVKTVRCDTASWLGEDEDDYAKLDIRVDGTDWKYFITKKYALENLMEICCGDLSESGAEEISISGKTAYYVKSDNGQMIFWIDSQGRSCLAAPSIDNSAVKDDFVKIVETLCKKGD